MYSKNSCSPWIRPRSLFFLMDFYSDGPCSRMYRPDLKSVVFVVHVPEIIAIAALGGGCEHPILGKRERGRIQGLPKFLDTPIISGSGKATDFNFFVGIFIASVGIKHIKNFGKSSRWRSQRLPKIFNELIYTCRAHRAVIFAIAQLSCPLSLRVSEILPFLCSSTPLFPTSVSLVSSKFSLGVGG